MFQALWEGRLTRDDLTARRIASFLGQTTMVLYHHFGSLDGFLIRVDGAGWRRLAELLEARARAGADARAIAVGYVEFALRHPDLYWLMAERRFDRAGLREQGRLRLARPLWSSFVGLLGRYGSARPAEDTHVLFAGLHGIAMLTLSGRANLGEDPTLGEDPAGEAPEDRNLGEVPEDRNLGEGPAGEILAVDANPGEALAGEALAAAGANPGEALAGEALAAEAAAFAAARRLADLVLPARRREPPPRRRRT
ncbi:TetR-like C-terminal domain-containing protein [Sorangium sp. So ce406]|uniref:TetR-like C-terminal domain-containing protein n=1 Tax=Sorangium sp. So ce406 TaxID=3133311 RepID=UPI003F5B2157